jgi:hypothetical protein
MVALPITVTRLSKLWASQPPSGVTAAISSQLNDRIAMFIQPRNRDWLEVYVMDLTGFWALP